MSAFGRRRRTIIAHEATFVKGEVVDDVTQLTVDVTDDGVLELVSDTRGGTPRVPRDEGRSHDADL